MSKFEVGDRVKIKQWSDMKNEFELDESGAIDCRCFFTKAMKSHCGRIGKIVSVLSDDRYMLSFDGKRSIWLFSDDMIEKGEIRMKFKVGDKVRAIDGYAKGYEGIVVESSDSHGLILCRFKNFKGHNGRGCTKRGKDYDTSDHRYVYPHEIELISRPNETIVIYRKDDKVIALDKRTGKKTEAKCHPNDEFNFETGAKLAFERLLEEPENKEQYYNGKIIFTKGDSIFKTGHIYEVIDGKILNVKTDGGFLHKELPYGDRRFLDLDDIKDYFTERDKRKNQPGWSSETLELIEVLDD